MLSPSIDSVDETLLSFDADQSKSTPIMRPNCLTLMRYSEASLSAVSTSTNPNAPLDKGKAVSKSLSIDHMPSSSNQQIDFIRNVDPNPLEFSSASGSQPSTSFGSNRSHYPYQVCMPDYSSFEGGKGKQKENQDPPQLPPLSFEPGHFLIDGLEWAPSPSHAHESASDRPALQLDVNLPSNHTSTPPNSPNLELSPKPLPPRRQSLPGSFAELRPVPALITTDHLCSPATSQFLITDGALPRFQYDLPSYHPKFKARSYSAPLPITNVKVHFEPQPVTSATPSYLDSIVPREIHLAILRAVVENAADAHSLRESGDEWTVLRASSRKNKWVGRSRGIRELVKLSRVSKMWRALAFDGQLWGDFDLHDFQMMPKSALLYAAKTAGSFVHSIDFTGISIDSSDVIIITDSFRLVSSPSHTQLTNINIQKIDVDYPALHHMLTHAPSLLHLNIRGSKSMRKSTCRVLAQHCPRLLSLDASRCKNLDGDGVQLLCAETMAQGRVLALKKLRLSGMRSPHQAMFDRLGKAAPFLEVLDISNVKEMHNSYLEAFVSVTREQRSSGVPYVTLTAQQVGQQEQGRYFRRVTKLRHLNLSSCTLLTDTVCSNLAFSMPDLEFLELAGIGSPLVDGGLIRLLRTIPHIRRLDLEDATDITDKVLQALTPTPPSDTPVPAVQTGQKLEHLSISYAAEISNGALLALIRACPHLRVVEADNTNISSTVIRELVNLSRERKFQDARVVAVDCRGISERLIQDLATVTRPRKGWRAFEARKLHYMDGRDGITEEFKGAQDECDPNLVVLKTFYSWQGVDAIAKERRARRAEVSGRTSVNSEDEFSDDVDSRRRGGRWWSSGRRLSRSGYSSPTSPDREGCIVM